MRAHLVRGLLAARGIDVDVVTTSREGQSFLAALGTPSELLSEHFAVAFEGCHDMARSATDACVLRYYLDPTRGLRDLAWLARRARGKAFVVCDSLHPALLVAPLVTSMRVVHVFGENIWEAARANFTGRAPAWFDRLYRRALDAMRGAAFACILHTLGPGKSEDPRTIELPPILPSPARRPSDVRAALGLGPKDRLAAVYLNPHFKGPRVAAAVERALAAHGFRAHLIGEGYARREGWRACDPDLASVVRAADLFISGAGMGALAQSRVFGTPLVALLGDQPEQRANAAAMSASSAPFRAVSAASPSLAADLDRAVRDLATPRLRALDQTADDVHQAWADAFERLVDPSMEDFRHEPRVTGLGDEQPARRGRARRRRAGGALVAFARSDAPARVAGGAHRHA
jgi:hypothetical protein